MKILIVSDSHGRDGNLEEVIRKVSPIDMLIHCGDVEGSENKIRQWAKCPTYMVAGNNDYFCDLSGEVEFEVAGYKVLVTHGHNYHVSFGIERLLDEARIRGIKIVLYGHTHRPLLEEEDGITVLNPGSISFPRQDGRKPSYAIMDIDKEGLAHFTINYLGSNRGFSWF